MRPASKSNVSRGEKALGALVLGQDAQGHRRAHQEVLPPMIFSAQEAPDINRSAKAIAQALACGRPGCPCGRRQGQEWRTHCPCHDDGHPSLTIAHAGRDNLLIHCHAGCPQDTVIAALRKRGLWPNRGDDHRREEPEATYDYRDGASRLLFQVVRYPHK
jgi:hypothetical protein